MVRSIPFKNRFVVRFITALAVVECVAMAASGWYFSSRSGQDAVEKAFSTDESSVRSAASYLESGFRAFGQNLTLLASTPALTSFDPAKAGEMIKSYVVSSLFLSGEDVVLFDNNNRHLADNRMVGGSSDTSGFPWTSSVEAVRPFSGPIVWKGDSPSKIFAVVVQNLASTSGILKAEFSFRRFFEFLRDARIGDKGHFVVVDEAGQILYHPQPKVLHDRTTLESMGIPGIQPAFWKISAPTVLELADGKRYMVNFSWIGDFKIGILSLHPMSEIDAIVQETRVRVAALMGLVLVLSLLVSAWLSLRMVQPLSVLSEKMQAVRDGDLTVESGIHRPDEIGQLAEVFDLMREKIRQYTEHLQDLVDEKMRQVRDILENIDQGLFTVNLDGTINPEHSKKVGDLLQIQQVAGSDVRKVLHLSDENTEDWNNWVSLVQQKHTVLRWEKLAKIAPVRELELGATEDKRTVQIGYQKVLDRESNLSRIMVLAQDITERRRTERIVAEQKERHENEVKTILGLVNTLPEVLQDYFEDLEKRLRSLHTNLDALLKESRRARADFPDGHPLDIDQDLVSSVFRDLHTIKGNSATYGFETLSRIAHAAEELLEALQPPIETRSEATLLGIHEQLDRMEEEFTSILDTSRRLSGGDGLVVRLPEERVEAIRKLASKLSREGSGNYPEGFGQLIELCQGVRDVPVERLVAKYATLAKRLADRLGKSVRVEVEPPDLQVDPHFLGRFDEALVHVVRNAIDHAIEPPEDREAAGKDPTGTLRLSVRREADTIRLFVVDDGRGIDGDKLARKAVEAGRITREQAEAMTWQQKIELVFESGLSTAEAVSDISGRGVGMDAARQGMVECGGNFLIRSEVSKGTEIELVLPRI
ncbi:MAG: HAMP domain-containing protein [Fibrobacteria bacterium]|nr:HAMP domain-containing protein [Fibrobacteria bacterium]